MLWKNRRESDNVVDQRSMGGKTIGGGALLVGALVVYLMGGNPLQFLLENANVAGPGPNPAVDAREADRRGFAGVVLADTEDVWTHVFRTHGRTYRAPKLVLFRGAVRSGCGGADQSVGPFYCPLDERVYMDLSFLDDLSGRLGAVGEFAGAYVIAHEVGHHVQKVLGLHEGLGQRAGAGGDARARNRESVRIELQADCLAGVWAHQNQKLNHVIEAGDLEQALGAAAAVGDDRLQARARGQVVPDSFTHGSSRDRATAFRAGFDGGDLRSCP